MTVTALLLSLVLAAPESSGPRVVLHLGGGRVVTGVIEQFDEARGIVLRRDDNGGRLPLSWHHLRPEEVEAIKRMYGFVGDEPPPVRMEAAEIRTRTGTIVGLIEGSRDGKLVVRRRDQVLEIPLEQVVGAPHTVTVDALEVELPERIYERRRAANPPSKAVDYYNFGLLAESLTLYEQAKEDFETCLELDPNFPKRKAIERRLERLAISAKEREQAEVLREIQALRARGRYLEAFAKAEEFERTWPDSSLLLEVQREKKRIDEARRASILRRIRTDFFTYLRRACEEKARDPEIGLGEAMTWAEEQAYLDVRAKLAALYGLPEEKVDELWEARPPSGSPIRASYGGGTFILGEKAKEGYDKKKAEQEGASPKEQEEGSEGKSLEERIRERLKQKALERAKKKKKKRTVGVIADVPPGPEEWWKSARTNERVGFLMALFAERSGKMEVIGLDKRACSLCGGKGFLEFFANNAGGDQDEGGVACPRCKTLTFDRIVVFR